MTISADVDEVDSLWAEFKATGDRALRDRLVLQYSPLVKYVAGRVRSGLPQGVESADLVSEGVIGLMDAIERFEPERGWSFQTYAVPRVRGAIIDSIRAADWVPRSVRTKVKTIDEARERLQLAHGRTPTDTEVAAEAEMTLAELRDVRRKARSMGHADDDEISEVGDASPAIDAALEDDGTREILLAAVREMPERDQVVLALYFFEGLTLGEIGLVLGVTESRVSQLRSRATTNLRSRLTGAL